MKATMLCLALCALIVTGQTGAREIKGVSLAEQITLPESTTPLHLNGAGVRSKFVFSIYVGALYLPTKATTVDAILQQAGPKRFSMHILYDEIEQQKLIDGWNEGFRDNNSDDVFAAVEKRLAQFNQLFEAVVKGDVIRFDYYPEQGTRVYIKDRLKGTVPGADFNQALLRVWLGDDPADENLKQALLQSE